jgi:DnaJ-class molecular chaperone
VRINIPRGVRSGFKIRLKERGHIGSNGVGDLYVTFDVEPHAYYRRRGDDLYITSSINPIEAMLGITRNVINAYGNTIKLKIPPGTQHGTKLRLRGQGVETNAKTGDLYVTIEIHIPEDLDDSQREIIRTAAKKARLI